MSGKIELNLSDSTLEELRCSICKGYLSCGPIRILPDGTNICGRCSPPNNDVPTYLQVSLEAIMKDATFPCKFSANGCKARLCFQPEATNNIHEMECAYRNGPEETTTFILHDAEITLKLGKDEAPERSVASSTDGARVLESFNVRKSSNVSSIVSVRDYNGYINSPRASPRHNNWNENMNNQNTGYNNSYQRNWNPYYNSYQRRGYNNNNTNRRNDVVVIKGHTIYVTL